MNCFSSLLTYPDGRSPADAQRAARDDFQNRVRCSHFSIREPSSPIPSPACHVIIGVASYSVPELDFLDALESAVRSRNPACIAVFDVTQCRNMDDFDRYIPGVGEVFQTPIVGAFAGGVLVEKATGLSEVQVVLRRLGILEP